MNLLQLPLIVRKHICLFLPYSELFIMATMKEFSFILDTIHESDFFKMRTEFYWPKFISIKPKFISWKKFYITLYNAHECYIDSVSTLLPHDRIDTLLDYCRSESIVTINILCVVYPELKTDPNLIRRIEYVTSLIHSNTNLDLLKYTYEHFSVLPDLNSLYSVSYAYRIDILNWMKDFKIFPKKDICHTLILLDNIDVFRWLYINSPIDYGINKEMLQLAKEHKSKMIAEFIQQILDDQ